MKSTLKFRGRSLIVAVIVTMLSVVGFVVYRSFRKEALDRDLIAAIKKADSPSVIKLLTEGANPNARDLPIDKRTFLARLWDNLFPRKTPPTEATTALTTATNLRSDVLGSTFEPVFLVKALLDSGANVNENDGYGVNPLEQAAWGSESATVRLLLQRGADVNKRDKNGFTVLGAACVVANPTVIKMLVDHGADVNAPWPDKRTCLVFVADSALRLPVAKILIDSGADVNSRDAYGETALGNAAMAGNLKCAELLVSHGAQVNVRDNRGSTPLSSAMLRLKDYRKVVSYFKGALLTPGHWQELKRIQDDISTDIKLIALLKQAGAKE